MAPTAELKQLSGNDLVRHLRDDFRRRYRKPLHGVICAGHPLLRWHQHQTLIAGGREDFRLKVPGIASVAAREFSVQAPDIFIAGECTTHGASERLGGDMPRMVRLVDEGHHRVDEGSRDPMLPESAGSVA